MALTYKENQVQRKLENADIAPLTWNTHNLANGDVFCVGVYEEDVLTAEQITSAIVPTVLAANTLNRHIVLEVTTLTTSGSVTLAGNVVNETTGVVSSDSETIAITATGFYQSAKKFIGDTTITGVTTTDLITDIHSTSYYDAQNHDFGVSAVRFSFTPSGPTWNIDLEVVKVNSDGSKTNLTSLFSFANTDTEPRAYSGNQGHAKVALSEAMLGSNGEGIVVSILNVSAIAEANIITMISGLDPETGLPFTF